jgi:peptidoglycan hydrolase-like protein with peptidoglycan-binding domain/3D (Asp-Asp-Asp) domain-containing protein
MFFLRTSENFIRDFFRLVSSLVVISILSMTPVATKSVNAQTDGLFPYVKTFKISAYYSPCEGQSYYVTGSFAGDKRLNGNGTHGADGTPVFVGMIAAPKRYPFGTKMSIPGVGVVSVHDRGGAIVQAGQRNQSYDRLDIWMGACEDGLYRALNWGKKTIDVTVYGVDESISEVSYLEEFAYTESIVKNVVLAPQLFEDDLWYLSTNDDVSRLQTHLTDLGFFSGSVSGYYGEDTKAAVYQFQLAEGVVTSPDDLGAGHTGVNTRKMLDLAVARFKEEQESNDQIEETKVYERGLLLLDRYSDLNKSSHVFNRDLILGSVGEDVRLLQQELVAFGYLRIEPTGYYGQVTEHAVFKFQQKRGLVGDSSNSGAGVFGPQTRSQLNGILESRLRQMSALAYARDERAVNSGELDPLEADIFVRDLLLGDRGEDVKVLQTLLKKLGFFKGVFLTEFYGEQTETAVRAFQLANRLIQSESDSNAGVVDEMTRLVLNSLL